jgi:hypothetical protein
MYIMAGSDFVQACPGISSMTCMQQFVDCPGRKPIDVIGAAVRNGMKNPNTKLYDRMQQYDMQASERRANWCLDYWRNSASAHKVPEVFGNGWSVDNGTIVPTNNQTSRHRRKRHISDISVNGASRTSA